MKDQTNTINSAFNDKELEILEKLKELATDAARDYKDGNTASYTLHTEIHGIPLTLTLALKK